MTAGADHIAGILDGLTNAVLGFDRDGTVVASNRAAVELFSLFPEAGARHFSDLGLMDLPAEWFPAVLGGEAMAFTVGHAPSSDPARDLRIEATPTSGPDGAVIGAHWQVRLTTGPTRSSPTALQTIIDALPNPLISFDRNNKLAAWNTAFERLVRIDGTGMSLGRSLVGVAKDVIRRVPSTEVGIKRMFRAIRSGEAVEFEWHRESESVFIVTGRPTANGGYVSMWRDVTSERRAHELVTTTQQRLVDAVETMSEGFALFDRNDRLVLCNARYRQVYGLPQAAIDECWPFERLVRNSIAHGQFPDAAADEEAWIAERVGKHRTPSAEPFMQRLRDGRTLLVVENQTREGGVVAIRADITERVRTENELREARDRLAHQTRSLRQLADELDNARRHAEDADAAKSRFLAMMSHELRTPMTGLLGMIELLSRTSLEPEQASFINIMRDSAETLLALLNDILDFSKLEAGKVQLEEIAFAPRQVLEDVLRLFQVPANTKGIKLSGAVADTLPDWLLGDPLRLKQILSNLVSNALKFTNDGSVTVALEAGERNGDRVQVLGWVQDTGIGIARDIQGQLFAAFEQAESSTTRRFGGTGLGLSICRRLVEGMDGWIRVSSMLGQGSTFEFCVEMQPAVRPAADADGTGGRDEPAEATQPIHILLAEDNDVNRMLVSRMLAQAGHRIDEVADGEQAVAAVRHQAYDLVLMDMQMPVMDGSVATAAIRELEGDRAQVPIIALTADAIPEHRAGYLEAGLDDVLLKPIDWQALNRVIAKVAASKGERGGNGVSGMTLNAEEVDEQPVFDRSRVRSAVGSLPAARAIEMIALVPDEAERQIALLDKALIDGDLEAIKRIAHTLKGLAANFGAVRLGVSAVKAEAALGSLEEARAGTVELRAAVAATRKAAPAIMAEFEAAARD